jgi:lambda family phage tail tape measure protein
VAAIGSLRVELELADGSFTTRIIRAGTTLATLERQMGQNVVAVRRLDSAMSGFGNGLRDMVVTLGLARAAIENLYSVFGQWATSMVRTNAEVERSIILLRGLSRASNEAAQLQEAREEFNQLLTLSARAPFSLRAMTDSLVKMRSAGIEPARDALQGLVDAVASAGGSDEQLRRASVAMQQMAGKGVISMEELRQQLGESVPRAIELMARSMNVTIAQLVDKISRGQVEAGAALQSLTAEFTRTFGGTALSQMDTFQGRLTQLQTAWTRFSLIVGGQPGSGGFFDAVKDALQAMTDALSGPEIQSFGRRLNGILSDLVNTTVAAVQKMAEWGNVIMATGRALLVLWVAVRGYAIITAMTTAIGFLAIKIAALPGSLAAATASLLAFRNAAAGATAWGTLSLTAYLTSVSTGFSALAAAASVAAARLSGWSRALLGLTTVGAVIVGLELLGQALRFVSGNADQANEALTRLREGQNNQELLASAQRRVDSLNSDLVKLRELQDRIQAAGRENRNLQGSLPTLESGPPLTLQRGSMRQGESPAEIAGRMASEVGERIRQAETEHGELLLQIRGASEERLKQQAEIFSNRRVLLVQSALNREAQAYNDLQNDIAARRRALAGNDALPGSEALQRLNQEALDSRRARHEEEIRIIEQFITTEEATLSQAQAARNARDIANSTAFIERLREMMNSAQRIMESGNLNGAMVLSTTNESVVQRAERRVLAMQARIAELRAEIERSNPELAKMDVLLEGFAAAGLPPSLLEQLREVARQLGEVEAEATKARRVLTLERQVNTGFERAQAEIERYTAALTNRDLPEAQRNFVTFQTQMNIVLQELGRNLDQNSDRYLEIAARIRNATEAAREAANLSVEVDLLEEARRARRQVEDRGPRRSAVEIADINRRADAAIARYQEIARETGDNVSVRIAEIQEARRVLIAKSEADVRRAGAGAARAAENQVAQMRGRVAELQQQVQGLGGEWAKWNQRLGESRTTAAGQEILRLAREVDQLQERLERLNSAYSTLERLRRQGMEGVENFDIASQMGRQAGGIMRAYVEAEARGRRAIEELQRDPSANSGELDRRRQQLTQDLQGIGQGILATQREVWQTQTDQINQSLATSREARRTDAMESIRIEEERSRRLIALSITDVEKRRELEDQLATFIAARRAQVERETESALQKQIREYSNLADNLDKSFASAFSGMTDALTEFVMTGKMNFKDLANSIIRDLVRIAIQAAASRVLGAIIGGAGGGFDLFGMGGGASAKVGIPSVKMHSGGIVGSSPLSLNAPMGLFANAPRFHKGGYLKDDEVPAILQRGEAVFTADQLAELGRLNRSYSFVEGMMGRLVRAATDVPGSAMPSMPSGGAGGANMGAAPPVTVNIINQSNQPMDAAAGPPRMDIEGMIVDVVISNMQRPGRMRDTVRGIA